MTIGLWALLGLLYMLIEAANNLPAASGKRQQLIDPLRGKGKTVELLYGPPQALKTVTRLN